MHKFLGLMLLAGCAMPMGAPVPQAARLSVDVLTVTLSDGTVCRADWAAAGGAGRLEPCGPGYGYAVRVEENPNVLRKLFTGLTEALGAEGALAPMAEVVITDPAGIDRVFVSPPPVVLARD
ncbi:MAG: hypothetical protein U1E06_22430 [Tabrizicola sp.]|uniref:hypothetical protein n=1 Tax=Tabrizicola sp. TaxID=2005166 RepID=UPI0027351764|nr:hypothetical protein [Tabrizicola sp.]MDP3261468.1 hypothetical protein [Tabrizicola sp.]MDP3649257.1 hypothetical protein [Paracoccaceae bacterium]MDZ4069560.1 hypothetical protein [Tabrizicola sp.]